MTTRVEKENMFEERGGGTKVYHSTDVIRGVENRDTTRQVSLFTSSELHAHVVYLHINNHTDHASTTLDLENKPEKMPELHAAVDGEPIEISSIDHLFNDLKIREGQTFEIWFSGPTYEERDKDFGAARFTWEPQDAASANA